ncbi:hypothetical protein SPOG_00437 [Schizosaccharomyces cryophilus OY26]|uniref:Uncharacterized protein n=1 Tax=Schizosaccharomyces cryophilus (strain OY26 / ATCC MYA-4695 / CBS 11777 / NBRC 106824 / NRRL Y48691) TaxID=653667 RepID=S9X4L5_SCHCR|nr:uncharacterized protein SPOG_00437 [Schizosaccharomyces cryophilus OY26]EPY52017.1 hypothetical protein SPOG_00437 [Schizosaccharomyces cryophilus OY26]
METATRKNLLITSTKQAIFLNELLEAKDKEEKSHKKIAPFSYKIKVNILSR